jgi:hypothetical protein
LKLIPTGPTEAAYRRRQGLIYACSEHDKTRGEPVVKKRAKRT